MAISESSLISKTQEKDVKYVIVTRRYYSLYFYLAAHPAFEEVTIVDDNWIFKVNHPVQAIASYPSVEWQTCIGLGTPQFLVDMATNYPAIYQTRLNQLEPWMGLTEQDLEVFMNWQGCQFEEKFPVRNFNP